MSHVVGWWERHLSLDLNKQKNLAAAAANAQLKNNKPVNVLFCFVFVPRGGMVKCGWLNDEQLQGDGEVAKKNQKTRWNVTVVWMLQVLWEEINLHISNCLLYTSWAHEWEDPNSRYKPFNESTVCAEEKTQITQDNTIHHVFKWCWILIVTRKCDFSHCPEMLKFLFHT